MRQPRAQQPRGCGERGRRPEEHPLCPALAAALGSPESSGQNKSCWGEAEPGPLLVTHPLPGRLPSAAEPRQSLGQAARHVPKAPQIPPVPPRAAQAEDAEG